MKRNDKIQTIIIIVLILIGICLLGFFTNRLISGNVGEIGQLRDGVRQLGSDLTTASGHLEEVQSGIAISTEGIVDHRESITTTETEYIQSATDIDNRINEHRSDTTDLITGLDQIDGLSELSERSSTRSREEIEGLRDLLQQLIDLEQD